MSLLGTRSAKACLERCEQGTMNGKKKNSRSKCLTVCHVNVRCLSAPTRLVDLEILCANNNMDILCLSETWLSPSHSSSTLKLNGFQPLFLRDRPCGSHGGVGIYERNSLSVTPPPLTPTINIECLCLCIHLTRHTKMNVIVGYRAYSSPGSTKAIFHSAGEPRPRSLKYTSLRFG